MNDLNLSPKPAAVRRAGGGMKDLNHITLGFVITFVLAGCLAATAQGIGVFTSTSTANEAHEGHTATLLTNGMVLIAGGYTIDIYESGLPPELTRDTELYEYDPADPASDGWLIPGNLNDYRVGHTATLLTNGQVLVAGGGVSSAELYNPVTGVWTYTGSLGVALTGHTATLLTNGQVLVAGGGVSSAELYNPVTGVWTYTGSLGVALTGHTATLLTNGKVLVAGDGELYD